MVVPHRFSTTRWDRLDTLHRIKWRIVKSLRCSSKLIRRQKRMGKIYIKYTWITSLEINQERIGKHQWSRIEWALDNNNSKRLWWKIGRICWNSQIRLSLIKRSPQIQMVTRIKTCQWFNRAWITSKQLISMFSRARWSLRVKTQSTKIKLWWPTPRWVVAWYLKDLSPRWGDKVRETSQPSSTTQITLTPTALEGNKSLELPQPNPKQRVLSTKRTL